MLSPDIGTCRLVYMFKKFVVKVPRLSCWGTWHPQWDRLKENMWVQRHEVKMARLHRGKPGIPVIHWADPFGLIVIMKRYQPVQSSELWSLLEELKAVSDMPDEFWEDDYITPNYAKDEHGKLVKIDLG